MPIDAITRLRWNALRTLPFHEGADDPRPAAERFARDLLEQVETNGTLMTHGPDRAPDAYVAWYRRDHDPGLGVPTARLCCDWSDEDGRAWVFDVLRSHPEATAAPVLVMVDANRPQLRDQLIELGLGIDSISLTGRTEQGLDALGDPDVPPGITIRPLETADIEPFLDLQEAVFSAEPQYCWFGGTPEFRDSTRRSLLEGRPDRTAHRWAVLDDRGLAGVFSCDHSDNPMWGPMGGLYFCFHRRIRGLGLTRPAYRRQLGALHADGVPLYRGSTSQPPILAMARVLARRPNAWNMRRHTHFPPEHFASWLT